MDALKVENLSKHFGGLKAIHNFSMTVAAGSIHALIGPNGAGKTTLVNCLSGLFFADKGSIRFYNQSLESLAFYQRARLGLVRTFQNLELCQHLNILENVLLGFYLSLENSLSASLFFSSKIAQQEPRVKQEALALLAELGIADYAKQLVTEVPYGVLKKMEIARILAASPKMLLLDEPVAGLNHKETDDIMAIIENLAMKGKAVLFIEHDMKCVMRLAQKITVMNFGEKLAEGSPQDIRQNDKVIAAYFGK